MKENSKLGFINPNLFLNRDYGSELRKFLLKDYSILQIVDFGDSGVFKDVTNYPCILAIQKNKAPESHKIKTIIINKPKERILYDVQKKYYQSSYRNEFFNMFDVEQKTLGEEQWKLMPSESIKISNKITAATNKTLKEVSERIYEGFITGANDVYFVSDEKAKQLRLERDILKPCPKGRNVKKWFFSCDNRYTIYPYSKIDGRGKLILDLDSKYPNVMSYLKENERKLKDRYCVKGRGYEWYQYHDAANIAWFNQPKIITPNLSTENNFAFDEEGVFLDHDCYGIILKDKTRNSYLYVLGLLNSHLLEFYLKQISPYASGKYYRYMTGYLEKLPIKLPETEEEKQIAEQIVNKVDEILELNRKLSVDIDELLKGEETEKLPYLASVSFSIRDDAKFERVEVKGDRIFISSEDYVEIKDKKIRDFVAVYLNSVAEKLSKSKDVKGLIYNIEVPKSDDVLNEIVRRDKTKIGEGIRKLEEEINGLVFEIYGVTEEEKEITEESLI